MRIELINDIKCQVFESQDVAELDKEPMILYWTKLYGKKSGDSPWNEWCFIPTVFKEDPTDRNLHIWLEYEVYEFAVPVDRTIIPKLIDETPSRARFPFQNTVTPNYNLCTKGFNEVSEYLTNEFKLGEPTENTNGFGYSWLQWRLDQWYITVSDVLGVIRITDKPDGSAAIHSCKDLGSLKTFLSTIHEVDFNTELEKLKSLMGKYNIKAEHNEASYIRPTQILYYLPSNSRVRIEVDLDNERFYYGSSHNFRLNSALTYDKLELFAMREIKEHAEKIQEVIDYYGLCVPNMLNEVNHDCKKNSPRAP